jgi:hypothetical protein
MLVLHEAGAIRECDVHGWIQDRADPHARNVFMKTEAGRTVKRCRRSEADISAKSRPRQAVGCFPGSWP